MLGLRRRILAGLLIVLCGCGSATPAAPTTPSRGPAASPAGPSAAPSRSAPSSSPSTSTIGRVGVGEIVFDRLRGSPEGDFSGIFVLGTDGVEQEVTLPFEPDGAFAVWSSDGRRLVVNSYSESSGGEVGILDLATSDYGRLTPKRMTDGLECSDWSPDDATVICAFGSDDSERDGIYAIDVATSRATRLTSSTFHHTVGTAGECGGGESRAVYSPDGTRLAYQQQRCGTGADPSRDEEGSIVVSAADGSGPRVVVPFGGVRTHPGGEISWSPDGRLIAFGTQSGEAMVVAPDGTGLRSIPAPPTRDGSFAFGPAWSPDGAWLLLAVGDSNSSDLYAVPVDGGSSVQLTTSDDTEAYTDWALAPR